MEGMASMKVEKKEGAEPPSIESASGSEYPAGLSMSMGSDEIDKLGLSEVEVGDEMEVVARGHVTSKQEEPDEAPDKEMGGGGGMSGMGGGGGGMGGMGGSNSGKKKMSMGFQVTEMKMKPMKSMGGGMKMGGGKEGSPHLDKFMKEASALRGKHSGLQKSMAQKRLLGAVVSRKGPTSVKPAPMKKNFGVMGGM